MQDSMFSCSGKIWIPYKIFLSIKFNPTFAELSRISYLSFLHAQDKWPVWKGHFLLVEICTLFIPRHILLSVLLFHSFWNLFMSQLLLCIAKEKKKHILVSTSPRVLAATLFSLTVILSHHSLGRTLKNDQSPLWPLDYAYNSLYKTISLWDLNSVPHRRETISTLIYSSSFTVELYWLRKCKVCLFNIQRACWIF